MNNRYNTALIIISLAVAGAFVYSARAELVAAISTVSLLFLVLVYAATLTQNVTLWLVFHEAAAAGNAYLQTSRMLFGGQVAKYIPGKVWGLVYQATLKSENMPLGYVVQANIVIYALAVLSVVFASAALIIYPLSMPLAVIVLVIGGVVSAWCMSSDHLYRIVQRFSRLSARFELTEFVPTTNFAIATRIGIYLLLIVSYVLSNVFLLYAFFDFDLHQVLRLSAYLGIAWLGGIVVVISPSGLGVREAIFIAIAYVSDPGSFELYASIAIVARAFQILQDLMSAFLVPAIVGLAQNKDKAGT